MTDTPQQKIKIYIIVVFVIWTVMLFFSDLWYSNKESFAV